MTLEQSQPLNLDEVSMHEHLAPVLASIVMPGGEAVSPEEAARRDAQGGYYASTAVAAPAPVVPVTPAAPAAVASVAPPALEAVASVPTYPPIQEAPAPLPFQPQPAPAEVVPAPEATAPASNYIPLPGQDLFDDLGASIGHLRIPGQPGVSRDELIYFGQLNDDLIDEVERLPKELARLTELPIERFSSQKGISEALSQVPFDKQLEVKQYVSALYRQVRLSSADGVNVVKSWTLLDKQGGVREVTDAAIEKLPPAIRQALSEAIISAAISGQEEYVFTRGSSL